MARRTKTTSLRTKLLLLLVVFALAPVAASTAWTLRTQARVFRESTYASLEALAGAKAEAIDQFSDYRQRDVERIANLVAPSVVELREARARADAESAEPIEALPDLQDAEQLDPNAAAQGTAPEAGSKQEPSAPADSKSAATDSRAAADEAVAALRRRLGLLSWDQEEFEELIVIDDQGRVIASTFEGHEEHSAEALEYFQNGLKTTFLQPVFMSPITKQLTMVISTPIRNQARETVGVLAARLNLKRFYRLINDNTGLGETGETLVGKKVGDEVLFMAPSRHDPEAALRRKVALGGELARPLQEAARGQTGVGVEADYRDVRVLAAWRYIPALDWGLVVKIDRDEALRAVEESQKAAFGIGAAIVALALLASVLISRAFVAPLRELQQATERLSRGDFDVTLDIRTNDEIGELADSFERMIAAIKFFRERSLRGGEDDDIEDDIGP